MPRFHFHVDNGQTHLDPGGTELPTYGDARREALRILGQFADHGLVDFWDQQSLRLTVTDDHGLTLVILELTAVESPSVR